MMKDQAIMASIHSPVKILLSPEEENIVDLISSAIINKTFDYETGTSLPQIFKRRTEQSQHRKAGHSNLRMDETQ